MQTTAATLTLYETAQIAGRTVERTSLLGYRIGSAVLDLAQVDALLGAPQPVPGLIAGPRATFGQHVVERWLRGCHADRRVAQLRRAGVFVTTRTVTDTRRLWLAAGADRASVEVTEITYCSGPRVPAITAPRVHIPW